MRDITLTIIGLVGAGSLSYGLWQASPIVCEIIMGSVFLIGAIVGGLADRGHKR